MQKATDAVQAQIDSRSIRTDSASGSTTPQADPETLKRAAGVWNALTQIFGASFVTIYGETPSRFWVERIAELTDAECRAGLDAIAQDKREYPVNLTEFVEACRPRSPGRRYLGTPTTPQAQRRLEAPGAERAHVDACLANMRRNVAAAPSPKPQPEEPPEAPPLLDGQALEAERIRQLQALAAKAQERQPGEDDEAEPEETA